MSNPVYITYLLFFTTFFQATHASFFVNTIYSVFFFLISGFSFRKYSFFKFFIGFLFASFLLCISYLFSSQSLSIGAADYLLSLRNIFMVVMSCYIAKLLTLPARARVFFRMVSIIFIINLVVVLIEYFTGFYAFFFLRPLADTYASYFEIAGRPLGLFLHPNTSAFFSSIYLFFLFLVLRNRFLQFLLLPLAIFFLSIAGSRAPLFIFTISVLIYVIIILFVSNKRFLVHRFFVFSSFVVFIFSSFFVCLGFDSLSTLVTNPLLSVIDFIFPTASNTADIIVSQFNESSTFYSIPYSCFLPSSYSVFNSSIESVGLHGNEVSLRYFLIAFSFPITGFLIYWLFRLMGIFSLFLALSLLHYHIAFTPLLLVMCIIFKNYFMTAKKLRGLHLV